jgi:hypothetical protein
MRIKQIQWSEEHEPNADCSYNHIIGDTPFGRFLLTWKGWKTYFDGTFDEMPWGGCEWVVGMNVEECKQWAQAQFDEKIRQSVEDIEI